jgi:hypothetical protein
MLSNYERWHTERDIRLSAFRILERTFSRRHSITKKLLKRDWA